MAKCYKCGKGAMHLLQVSHAKQRTSKWSKPNLHSTKVKTGSGMKRVKMCTKCLRKHKASLA